MALLPDLQKQLDQDRAWAKKNLIPQPRQPGRPAILAKKRREYREQGMKSGKKKSDNSRI